MTASPVLGSPLVALDDPRAVLIDLVVQAAPTLAFTLNVMHTARGAFSR